jgi:predicted ATPase
MRRELPSGTVTFLFTDVEGSTRLLHELGAEAYARSLAEHRRLIREACAAEGGVEVDTQGDAFFFAFPTAPGALAAASAFIETLASGPIRVRVGLHTGTPLLTEESYVGDDVHFAARVAASGHGGQVVCSAATAELVELPLTDLGEHRLKDIAQPVAIFQLGVGAFPPLKTISNTNLPRPASSFVGREAEVEAVRARIAGGARFVTLTGPGGSGKTRLAIEAASTLVPEYKAGVFWVGLAALRDPALVTETIAQTLGATDGLAEHVGEREMLLLLDNLEQVIEAAPKLSALLESCLNLTLLVTSREVLRVRGEVAYPVPPLAEPEAVSLFCERAQLKPSDEIAELCARLDSLPLAVELAAARTKALSPAQILERLSQRLDLLKGGRDADPRQQTLRATIEWSYDLLSSAEQLLFARLSVFAGGCTLEAAEEVAGADLDTLQSLAEKSLLRFTNERYWLLETIREYAGERLAKEGADEVRQRHLEFFLRMAEEAEPELRGPHASEWLDRLEAEHHNLRAGLSDAASKGQGLVHLRLAGALARFWWTRAYLDEGKRWLEDALAQPGAPPDARARALRGLGYLTWARGERGQSVRCHEEALALYREIGDSFGTGASLMNVGVFWREEGDLPRARRFMEEAASMQRASGDVSATAHTLGQLGLLALAEGDLERAARLCEEGLALARGVGNEYTAAIILRAIAPVALQRGDYAEAARHFGHGLEISRRLGYEGAVASCLEGVAAVAAASGDHERAARLLGAANALDERLHGTPEPPEPPDDVLFLEIARSYVGDERALDAWAEGRSMSPDDAVEYALSTIN